MRRLELSIGSPAGTRVEVMRRAADFPVRPGGVVAFTADAVAPLPSGVRRRLNPDDHGWRAYDNDAAVCGEIANLAAGSR